MPYPSDDARDRPWVMRTYAGHSSARASNELYRRNLEKGQTGLSVAFDLPTQTGYDPDAELAKGEVGKVGVPVSHIGDMRALFDRIPLDEANTSMTINATAMWMLALYVTVADEQGADRAKLAGTTQNDIVKEYLSRGTYAFPPGPSVRLITDMIAWTVHERPQVEPDQHLQLPPAGGRGDADAGGRLHAVDRDRGARRRARLGPGARGRLRPGRRAHLVLRQRGPALHRGDREAAGVLAALGRAVPRALRRRRTPRCGASATACRSTRWGSPRPSRRTTSSASCWRCSR